MSKYRRSFIRSSFVAISSGTGISALSNKVHADSLMPIMSYLLNGESTSELALPPAYDFTPLINGVKIQAAKHHSHRVNQPQGFNLRGDYFEQPSAGGTIYYAPADHLLKFAEFFNFSGQDRATFKAYEQLARSIHWSNDATGSELRNQPGNRRFVMDYARAYLRYGDITDPHPDATNTVSLANLIRGLATSVGWSAINTGYSLSVSDHEIVIREVTYSGMAKLAHGYLGYSNLAEATVNNDRMVFVKDTVIRLLARLTSGNYKYDLTPADLAANNDNSKFTQPFMIGISCIYLVLYVKFLEQRLTTLQNQGYADTLQTVAQAKADIIPAIKNAADMLFTRPVIIGEFNPSGLSVGDTVSMSANGVTRLRDVTAKEINDQSLKILFVLPAGSNMSTTAITGFANGSNINAQISKFEHGPFWRPNAGGSGIGGFRYILPYREGSAEDSSIWRTLNNFMYLPCQWLAAEDQGDIYRQYGDWLLDGSTPQLVNTHSKAFNQMLYFLVDGIEERARKRSNL